MRAQRSSRGGRQREVKDARGPRLFFRLVDGDGARLSFAVRFRAEAVLAALGVDDRAVVVGEAGREGYFCFCFWFWREERLRGDEVELFVVADSMRSSVSISLSFLDTYASRLRA